MALIISIISSQVLIQDQDELVERVLVMVNGVQSTVISEKKLNVSQWNFYLPSNLSRIPGLKSAVIMKMYDWDPDAASDLEV